MTSNAKDVAPCRIGSPWPLHLYYGAAAGTYVQALRAAIDKTPKVHEKPFPELPEIAEEAVARLEYMLAGIHRWKTEQTKISRSLAPAVWEMGHTSLHAFAGNPAAGPAVIVVPSLINGAEILDLDDNVSLLAVLAQAGLRPFVLVWGTPGEKEQQLDLTGYVLNRLSPAVRFLKEEEGKHPHMLGYCLGGTLCLGLAEDLPPETRLCLLGAPWDFARIGGIAQILRNMLQTSGSQQAEAQFDALGRAFGVVPSEVFQMLFCLLDPLQAARKFRRFAKLPNGSRDYRRFVEVEDWLNSGQPVAVPAAKQLLLDWYGRNIPARGEWKLGDRPAEPGKIAASTMIVTGAKDHIVPKVATLPLVQKIPSAIALEVPFGHVGMIVSTRAKGLVADRVAAFLRGDPS